MNTHTIPLPNNKVGPLSSPSILKLGEQAKAKQPTVALPKEQAAERVSRVPYKLKGKSLQLQYRLTLQIGAILALLVMLVLFKVPIQLESSFENEIVQQEIVQIEEIIQTEQQFKAPPPPRPVVPIEVPNDEVLEEEEFELDVALDIEQMIEDLEPPSLPEETKQPEIDDAEIFMVVEEMPEIIGGVKKLYEYVTYPAIANKAGLEGVVIVGIVIEKTGVPVDLEILKSVHPILDESAMEAVSKVRFTPGKQRGQPVRVKMAIPIRYKLKTKDY